MTTITKEIDVFSEDGLPGVPHQMEIRLDGSKPDCPVTFYVNMEPVFTMGNDEIPMFVEALEAMNVNP